ncbi:hypothetical protein [Lactiplantibacillus plantarum]|uniref:hypothetical protein n=1 Tax=Lactiplantibacillus plantarum TaxID=1590 RepID=UPI0007B54CE7|nr:hypothetical protein [Lactiplantibacillus plantarum]KZU18131.1 hypothetical protein Nizo2484_2345 [Lactiplantibacillus plantarum]
MDQRTEIEKIIKHDGLEKFLLDQGIGQEAIDASKKEIAQEEKQEYKFYYDDTGKTAENIQIPVSQIRGVSRISGYSWFKLLEYSLLGVPSFIPLDSFNLNRISFLNWVSTLAKTNLQTINEIYQKADTLEFSCYEKNGIKEYYGINDGNHRTITAKIYGLQELPARRVNYYEFNDDKYQEYQMYKAKKKEFGKLLERLGLFVDFYGCISFQINDSVITITDYPFENLVDGHRPISEMIGTADLLTPILEEVKNFSERFQQRYRHYPTVLKHFLYQQLQNNEIRIEEQDFAKKMGRCIALKRVNN